MQCPNCGGSDVGRIGFSNIGSGTSFHYCRVCEHRWWLSASEQIELSSVLKTAANALARAS